MELLQIIWPASIGIAFIVTLLVAIIFWQQQGRLRLYLSIFLFSIALHAGVMLFTLLSEAPVVSVEFILPRTVSWLIMSIAGSALILYQLGVLNHQPRGSEKQ